MVIVADKIVLRPDRKAVDDGAVVVRSGKIIASGRASGIIRRYPGHGVVRVRNSVLMPGLVNAHAHIELPRLPGSDRSADYAQWVLNLLKFKKHLAPEDYAAAARSNVEVLMSTGTTTVADISTHGASPAVIRSSGLRAVIYREIIAMGQARGFTRLPLRQRPAEALIRFGISPHSPHTVSETVLKKVQRYARRTNSGICMHVAETKEELRLLRGKASGLDRLYTAAGWDTAWAPRSRSSFEYLRRTGILGPRFLAVHAVHCDAADIEIIRRSGSGIAHCPRSNRRLGVGKMRLAAFLSAGIPVGIGTDSLASVPSLSLWDEMRHAYRIHRSSGVSAAEIMQLATMGGARALGMERVIGSIEPGKRADMIAVPLPKRKTGDLATDLLRDTKSCIMTMVNGKIIYQQQQMNRR